MIAKCGECKNGASNKLWGHYYRGMRLDVVPEYRELEENRRAKEDAQPLEISMIVDVVKARQGVIGHVTACGG
jgi:hypothetical protein